MYDPNQKCPGTWRSAPGQVEKAVEVALKSGYTSIDTATGYGELLI
jgi:glycerol 2-dehydrogenase (NADP+)